MRLNVSRYRLRNSLIAGGLAIAGALLVLFYVASYRNDVQSGADLVDVYVASRDIPEGTDGATVAGSDYLRKETVLRRNAIKGAIASSTRIATLATSQKILEGEQVTLRQFHPAAEQGVLANISGNRRAMTVTGEPSELLAGIVDDGDHVDVVANIGYSIRLSGSQGGGELKRVATRIILRDLEVLDAPTGSASDGGINGSDTSAITLALTDGQAQKLLYATKNGTWWLLLRPVAQPLNSPETVETIESMLSDGLRETAIDQLTSGNGAGSISSGG